MAEPAHHRPAERENLKRLLLSGRNVLMLAPRRVGKTWLMDHTEGDLEKGGYSCIHIDVEGKRTEDEFLRVLCQEIDKKQEITESIKSYIKAKIQQVKGGSAGDTIAQMVGTMDSRLLSETLVGALNQRERRTVVMIDEFSLFVLDHAKQDPDSTRALLYHLRGLQQKFTNVSWLLTGSIGLDVVARRLNLEGAFLDFEIFPLAPFTDVEARSFLVDQSANERPEEPFDFDEDAFRHLIRELGWLSPYYLRHLAGRVRPSTPATSDSRAIATQADVAQAFEALLSPNYRTYFASWKEHIQKNFLPGETNHLTAILAKCCEHADGEREDTLLAHLGVPAALSRRALKDLLLALDNDGYLVKEGERWRFRSGLLRRHWLEYIA